MSISFGTLMEKLDIESLKKCVFAYNVVGNLWERFVLQQTLWEILYVKLKNVP